MLKLLLGSETRVRLLNLLILHPENRYSCQELTKELKLTSFQINKELLNTCQLGLVSEFLVEEKTEEKVVKEKSKKNTKKKEKKIETKKIKFFSINKSFLLYPEIRALFVKAQLLSSQNFILNLEKSFSIKLLLVTGFFTNCQEAPTDLLIVGGIKRTAFLKLISELEKDLGREINFTIMDENEFNYRQEIMDIFLYNIIESKKIVLIDNLSET